MPVSLRLAGVCLATWSLAVCGGGASDGAVPLPSPQPATWTLSWSDEFDAGSRPDESRWVYDLGGGGWGNQELQTYTSRADNAALRDGALVITARAERFTGSDGIARDYTSARLKTKDRFAQTYGKFEARIQVPRGQGIWPAFWMLGVDIDAVGWPQCGEIDIMENIGREPTTIHGTLHGPGYSGGGGPERSIVRAPTAGRLPTPSTCLPSSGSPARFAGTSTAGSTSAASRPICPPAPAGCSTTTSSCC